MAIFAKRLFDLCPPQELANDPRVFLTGVIELFEAYPSDIVERAVSVVHGLPSKHKWAPHIAEIKEFLEELMGPARREERRLRLEEERLTQLPPPVNRAQRPTYEELKARRWAVGLYIGDKKPPDKSGEIERHTKEFRAQNNISDDIWNSIPNARE